MFIYYTRMLKLSRNMLTILLKILEYYVILPKIFLKDTKKTNSFLFLKIYFRGFHFCLTLPHLN